MKVCIKGKEFNPSFIAIYGEEKAIEQGYTIFEVPQGCEDCSFDDFDKQLTQPQWQDDFTVSHDDYFNKDYANIDELKAQAKIVRNKIRELRK